MKVTGADAQKALFFKTGKHLRQPKSLLEVTSEKVWRRSAIVLQKACAVTLGEIVKQPRSQYSCDTVISRKERSRHEGAK